MKKYLLMVLMLLSGVMVGGCQQTTKGHDTQVSPGQKGASRLFGMGCPIYFRYTQDHIDYKKTFKLMAAMGVKSWRCWMHATWMLRDERTINPESVALMKAMLAEASMYDIEIVGMSHDWFNGTKAEFGSIADPGKLAPDSVAVPARDMTEGSEYRKFLDNYETSWETLARAFPEVTRWEVGNEWNHDPFLHPMDYKSSGMKSVFTWKQKAAISTDMLYYASRGIHRANPQAQVILGGLAPVYDVSARAMFKQEGHKHEMNITISGIAAFLALIYENITNGQWPSTNTNDYFQAVAWHPYSWDKEPDGHWVAFNDLVYQVMVTYGDRDKEVYFTEWGLTEAGKPEKGTLNADYLAKAYQLIQAHMPYVRTMHYFRMYEDMAAVKARQTEDWGGLEEVYYGAFTEPDYGWRPKAKAIRFQELAGGKGDLWEFATK